MAISIWAGALDMAEGMVQGMEPRITAAVGSRHRTEDTFHFSTP